MPHADHRVSPHRPAAALLATFVFAASPAAAEPARSQLRVGARVLPACEVTADGAGAAAACTNGSDMNISIKRRGDAPSAERPAIARVAEAGDSASTQTWVTVTY